MANKYRKKPVEVEAVQYTGDNFQDLAEFVGKDLVVGVSGIYIRTLEGDMLISIGDYVIRGVNGEFYPCKPDIFEKTYEECLWVTQK